LVRPFIAEVIEQLLARHAATQRVDLNDIAEVIGTEAVSYDEVEHIIGELERSGCAVGGPPTLREMGLLREVLDAARTLRGQLERRPTVEEIAEVSGKPVFVVRRALENAGTLGRTGEQA
jgi:Glu-tRNA(Gln) amidotransferase subunit E-like FAD-binding protein